MLSKGIYSALKIDKDNYLNSLPPIL
jgi:hypothetical protein